MNIPSVLRPVSGLTLLLFICFSAQAAVNWLPADLEALQEKAQREDKLFILYFTADWCAPCQWMEQNTFQDGPLNRYLRENYLAAKVDLNNIDNKILQHQFEVEVIPSVLVFATNGKLIDRRTGSEGARPLLRWLRHLNRPAHHADASLPEPATSVALTSPQKNTTFSRPALVPDMPEPGMLSFQESSTPPSSKPSLVLSGEPLAMSEPAFAPRSSIQYSVRLQKIAEDYSTAVYQIGELERKFETRAELQPLGNGQFYLLLGTFETTGEAQRFLQFLARNDRLGEIVPLDGN